MSGLRKHLTGVARERRSWNGIRSTSIYRRNGEPYNVALIDLDEGFRMMSQVGEMSAEEVTIGSRVQLKVSSPTDEEEEPVAIFVQEGEEA